VSQVREAGALYSAVQEEGEKQQQQEVKKVFCYGEYLSMHCGWSTGLTLFRRG
jgi:hypothetical protein